MGHDGLGAVVVDAGENMKVLAKQPEQDPVVERHRPRIVSELGASLVLVAFEVARRRVHGRLGARHGYEPAVALTGASRRR